jgi:hypothetical protein
MKPSKDGRDTPSLAYAPIGRGPYPQLVLLSKLIADAFRALRARVRSR